MAVPCPRCGRSYDVTLFEFGRTIWCTCGSRVGMEPRVRELGAGEETRFIADAMLGRLARWLRLLGFDCAYENEIADRRLVECGVDEKRVILTRDRALAEDWRVSGIHVVGGESTFEQIVEVVRRFDLARSVGLFRRCSECNELVRPVPATAVAGRVPERIAAEQEEFRECPRCGRVYWEGSHADRMRRTADRILAAAARD